MKNYAHQLSDFTRIRDTLVDIAAFNAAGVINTATGTDLAYALVRARKIKFRDTALDAAPAVIEARIEREKLKELGDQGPVTTTRDLKRTLRDFGWLTTETTLTPKGNALLETEPGSYEEQALIVEALLGLEAVDDAGNAHRPVRTLLSLLAIRSSVQREGLELALEPKDDSPAEFARVAALYDLEREPRLAALDISENKRSNAVKILPSLAVAAGLVANEGGVFSLTQDGWAVARRAPTVAAGVIRRRTGRRTTSGRKVSASTVAARQRRQVPRTLSPEEQRRAADRLNERTASHQALVKRIYDFIGDDRGDVFEDEFSYDLLWVPKRINSPVYLFEMKSVTTERDAYARVRDAVGQLHYYEHFNVRPSIDSRPIHLIAAFDSQIPPALVEYLRRQKVGVIVSLVGGRMRPMNSEGHGFSRELRQN